MLPKHPSLTAPVFLAGRLGTSGMAAPLDAHVADTLGLVHPIGSRITMTFPDEKPGHQKALPFAWLLAEFADASAIPPADWWEARPEQTAAARRALACGELAELRAAVREPLTVSRFFANLAGAFRRTRLVIPADPIAAERAFCR